MVPGFPLASLFFVGFAVSAAVCGVLVRARRHGSAWGLDQPDEPRKIHPGAIPRTGGIGLFLVFLAVGVVTGGTVGLLAGGCLMFLLGFGDDLVRLNSLRKFLAQIAIALLCFGLGLRFPLPESWSGDLVTALSLLLTVMWLVGWTNALNLIDGMDGLAGGITWIGMTFLSLVGTEPAFTMALAGAAAGFLGFNFPRARLFLGDGGAYLSGFAFGGLALQAPGGEGISFLIVLLAIPLLDTGFAFVRRLASGRPVMKGDAGHIHHRLRDAGLGPTRAVLVLLALTVASGLVAWVARSTGHGWTGLAWVALLGGGMMGAGLLGRASNPEPAAQKSSSAKPSSSSVVGSDTVSNSST